jgi:hypothetical protein
VRSAGIDKAGAGVQAVGDITNSRGPKAMNGNGIRKVRTVAATLTAVLLVAACAGTAPTAPTPMIVYVTLSPAPATATPAATPTPATSATAGPSEGPVLTEAPSLEPSVPAAPGETCSGTANFQALYAEAAAFMHWDVYCPVLPKGWYVKEAEWKGTNGGVVRAVYGGPHGAVIGLAEGSWCTTSPAACAVNSGALGGGAFGDLAGSLYLYTSPTSYVIYVHPGTVHAYAIAGQGITKAAFLQYAAALIKVPKA